MSVWLDQLVNKAATEFWAPYLPGQLVELMTKDSITAYQLPPKSISHPAIPGERWYNLPRAGIILPSSLAGDRDDALDQLMINATQAELGVPEVVCVLDTGMMTNHPMIRRLILESVDTVNEVEGDRGGYDWHGHGTVAAMVIALTSPHIQFVNIKVANAEGQIKPENLVRGIEEAVARQPNRISISLGFNHDCSWFSKCDVCKAAEKAAAAGYVIFAAAGNKPGKRACPARAKGVYSVASGTLASPYAEVSSLDKASQVRLMEGDISKNQSLHRAFSHSQHFLLEYQRRYASGPADEDAWRYLDSALILAKEIYLQVPDAKRKAQDLVEAICEGAQRFPFRVAGAILDRLWYHLPDRMLKDLSGTIRGLQLHGTSFSIGTTSGFPFDMTGPIRGMDGQLKQGDLAVLSRMSYSGSGEFLGIDGRYLMIPYELGLLKRVERLSVHQRIDDALMRFESYAQPPKLPDDFLELALLYLAKPDLSKAKGAINTALQLKPNWPLAMRIQADMQ
jgi:hypothetical protein